MGLQPLYYDYMYKIGEIRNVQKQLLCYPKTPGLRDEDL